MRAQWKQRGGSAGEYIIQKGRGEKREVLAKIDNVSFDFPSPGSVLVADEDGNVTIALDRLAKVKRSFQNGNGQKVTYFGAEAIIADWLRKGLSEVQKIHRAMIEAGQTLTTESIREALDSYDPSAKKKRKSTADSVRDMAAAAGLADSTDVQKLLAMLSGSASDEDEDEDEEDEDDEE